jgi:predicted enzyme related to lactoylglutathione lyase
MADKVVHFEIPTDDVARAQKFYKDAFGWGMVSVAGTQYTILHTGPTDQKTGMLQERGVINGGLLKRQKPVERILITIQVDDLDGSLKKVQRLDGKVVQGRQEVPGVGWTAYVMDTEGNTVGLIQPNRARQT